eukprot:868488-Pyramimonas_sp.AAC.1
MASAPTAPRLQGSLCPIVDSKRICIKCDVAARPSHRAVVIPLGDASVRRPMAGRVVARRRGLQGAR